MKSFNNLLFTVKSPLCIHSRLTRVKTLMAEFFPHPAGLIYFEPYWHLDRENSQKIHVISGEIQGEGPWKLGEMIISIAACQGLDPEMAAQLNGWRFYLETNQAVYPSNAEIMRIACKHGAII